MVLNFRENNNLMQFTVSVPLHSLVLQIFEQRQSRLTLKSVILWTMGGKRVPVMNSDFVWTKCLKCLFLFTENILYEGPVSVWTEWITETQCEIVNKTESEQQPSVSRDHVQWFLKYYCNQPACVYFTKHHVSTSLFFFLQVTTDTADDNHPSRCMKTTVAKDKNMQPARQTQPKEVPSADSK